MKSGWEFAGEDDITRSAPEELNKKEAYKRLGEFFKLGTLLSHGQPFNQSSPFSKSSASCFFWTSFVVHVATH